MASGEPSSASPSPEDEISSTYYNSSSHQDGEPIKNSSSQHRTLGVDGADVEDSHYAYGYE